MPRNLAILLPLAAILLAAAAIPFAGGSGSAAASPTDGVKLEKLIFTAIPDDNAEKLKEHYGAVAAYLTKEVGIPVEYMHVENYAAAVTALATGQAHFSWMGGVTTVQAHQQTKGKAEVIACRDIDKKFVTYFIAGKDSGIGPVKDLAELATKAAGKSFTFGSKGSTSGHLMPRHFFTQAAKKNPEDVFKTVAYSGSHDKTLAQVADGSFAVGALNYATYDKSADDLKAKAPIIFKTPSYVDYCFIAHTDIGPELIGKLRKALLALDPAAEPGKKILGGFKAAKFVEAHIREWDGIRAVMDAGVDIGA
jgi:phosphonate transport system substrate-binding protein